MMMFDFKSSRGSRLSVILTTVLVNLVCIIPPHAGEFTLSKQVLANIEQEYGDYARRRVSFWKELITGNRHIDEREKLRLVNDFFNQLAFVNDIDHWGLEDYWATPLQMLASNGGDCEDFSIAKYFTLREMGIPAERMRLTYVKAVELNQAHMVLTYFASPESDPLVLDNLDTEIRPASDRKDLLPVYSFNGNGLWLAKSRGNDQRIGHADRLSRWKEVIARISDEQVPLSR
jgi:predicted transglutaminase-like cysteine proteinase